MTPTFRRSSQQSKLLLRFTIQSLFHCTEMLHHQESRCVSADSAFIFLSARLFLRMRGTDIFEWSFQEMLWIELELRVRFVDLGSQMGHISSLDLPSPRRWNQQFLSCYCSLLTNK